jgi:SAM-dependent methyltransferase
MNSREPYVSDNVFPSGFVAQIQPALLSYIAATGGYLPPDPKKPFVFLELGCGTGVSLNVLAAANPGCRFIGIDFNPAHISIAREDAAESCLRNVTYLESAFENVTIDELPECDYIAINGTYSWLPPKAVAAVHDMIANKLRPGGLFYVDYLSAWGRAPISPLWLFLREITKGFDGASEDRIAQGMAYLRRMSASGSRYLQQNPMAKRVLNKNLARIDNHDPRVLQHLAHHALAEHQEGKYFAEIQTVMRDAGLQYAGNALTWRNDPAVCLPPDLQALCSGHDDPAVRELVKDFFLSETQRKDVFVKATAPSPESARESLLQNLYLVAMRSAESVIQNWESYPDSQKILMKPGRSVQFLLDGLDRGIFAFRDLAAEADNAGIPFDELIQAVNMLVCRPDVHICREMPEQKQSTDGAELPSPFNRSADGRSSRSGRENLILASPVLGSGIVLGPAQRSAFREQLPHDSPAVGLEAGKPISPEIPTPAMGREFESRLLPRLRLLRILD